MYYHSKNSLKDLHKYNAELRENLVLTKENDPYRKEHKYVLTQSEILSIFHKKLYIDIINTDAFKRLKDIKFLGSIDYVLDTKPDNPIKRHNRYQHSIGVARLALQYAQEKGLSEKEENLCVVSALLHDIGHAPLSHSLESVFKENFGIGHHIACDRIIKGEVEIGRKLNKTLLKSGLNPFEIMMIISGKGGLPYSAIFNHAINIDTIEGILRSTTYLYETRLFSTPAAILESLINVSIDSQDSLDKFWELKGFVYSALINNRTGVFADFICQDYMRKHSNKFKEEYYFGREENLKKKHASLFRDLRAVGLNRIKFSAKATIRCMKRIFIINKDVELVDVKSIDSRYTQLKKPHQYEIKF